MTMDRERDLPGPNAAAAGCEVRAARRADVPRIWEMLRGLAEGLADPYD